MIFNSVISSYTIYNNIQLSIITVFKSQVWLSMSKEIAKLIFFKVYFMEKINTMQFFQNITSDIFIKFSKYNIMRVQRLQIKW